MNQSIENHVSCKDCKNASVCMISGLNSEEARELTALIENRRPLNADQHLYYQGEICQNLYLVKSGSFRGYMVSSDGVEQTISFYLPGDLIGLEALDNGGGSCSIAALETSTVCTIPLAPFLRLCTHSKNVNTQFFHRIGQQIATDYHRIAMLAQRSAIERTANFLCMVSNRYGLLGYSKTHLKLSMSRQDIANFLGLTIETLSRQLATLNKMRIINIQQRWVSINNMEALKKLVEKVAD